MNLVVTVLQIVAPVFLLAGIGFAWVKLGFEYRIEFVTRLAMTLAVPCLVFTSLMKTELPAEALTTQSFAAFAGYALIACLSFAVVRLLSLGSRTYLAPLIFGNTGNLGLPLALFAFGDAGLSLAIIVFAFTSILSFTIGVWIVSGGGSITRIFSEPLVGATLLGALFMWQDWQTPLFLTNTLDMIGQMAIPMMLLTLGVAVARLKPSSIGRAVILSGLKLILCAGVAWGVGTWLQLDHVAFGVLALQLATPVAVTSYLLAEKYGADADQVAGLVVVSTVMAIGALPLLLGLLL